VLELGITRYARIRPDDCLANPISAQLYFVRSFFTFCLLNFDYLLLLRTAQYFLLFIFYTSLSCLYSLFFIFYRFLHCISHHTGRHGPRCVDHPSDLLPLIGLTVEALLFGLFTICMMVDQWDVVMTNLTHIDRLKGEHHHTQFPHYNSHNQHGQKMMYAEMTRRAGINEVFGTGTTQSKSTLSPSSKPTHRTGFHPTWLSPLHKVCFPESVRDDIFGYCQPCSLAASGGIIGGARRISTASSMEMTRRGDSRVIDAAEIV